MQVKDTNSKEQIKAQAIAIDLLQNRNQSNHTIIADQISNQEKSCARPGRVKAQSHDYENNLHPALIFFQGFFIVILMPVVIGVTVINGGFFTKELLTAWTIMVIIMIIRMEQLKVK